MATALILLFLPRLAEMRNMRAKVDVGKIEASGKEFRTAGRTRVDSGQAGTDRWKMKGQHWTQGSNLGHRLIENVRGRFFVGNLRLGSFRQLVAATRTCGDGAVGEEEFSRQQPDLETPSNPFGFSENIMVPFRSNFETTPELYVTITAVFMQMGSCEGFVICLVNK